MNLLLATCAFLGPVDQPASWFNKQAQAAIKLCETGKAAQADEIIDQMRIEADRQKNVERQIFVLWKRGYCQYVLGDYTHAQETLIKARDQAPKNLRFLNLINRELGEAYFYSGKVALAEPCLQIVLDGAAGKGPLENPLRIDDDELVRIHLLKVGCQLGRGKFAAAQKDLAALEAKIAEARKTPAAGESWARRFAECQMFLSVLDRRGHNMVAGLKRLEAARESLQGSTAAGSLSLQYECSLKLASCYWQLARFPEAQRQLDLAEKALEPIANERTLGNLKNARAGLAIEQTSFALDSSSSEIIPVANAPGSPKEELDRAEKSLTEALAHYAKADKGQDLFTATANFQLAQVHELRGRTLTDTDRAKREFEKGKRRSDAALDMLTPLVPADSDDILEVRHKRAWLFLRLGDVKAARQEATETFALFVKNHGKDDLDCGRFHHLLLEIEDRAGNIRAAAAHADAHRRLVSGGLVAYLAGLTAPEQIQFFRKWDDPGLYASLRLGIRHAESDPMLGDMSAEWLINGKAMVAEALAQVRGRVKAGNDYGKFQHAIQRQAYLLYGDPGGDRKLLQQELLWEEAKKRDLTASWQFGRNDQHWRSLADVRKRLTEKEVYVGIFSLRPDEKSPRAYYAWVVASTGPARIAKLGDAARIEKLVNDLIHHQEHFATIRLDGEKTAEKDLKQTCLEPLSRLVLDPILNLAKGKDRWIISPDGLLWNVPWTALVLPVSQKYAVEEIAFRHVISGRELVDERERVDAKKLGEPLLLGDPDLNLLPAKVAGHLRGPGDPLWMPEGLPASRTECRAISKMMKEFLKQEPSEILGDMTKDKLLRLEKPPLDLYLSTHSFAHLPTNFQADDPMLGCAIAFAGWNYVPDTKADKEATLPGLMTAAEVLGVNLRGTELVVLASCQSGTGVLQYGQSPADLRHAFHLAGARTVVSSLWSVNDKSTLELMVPFMEKLCRQPGSDEADALRTAQLEMIAALRMHRNRAHPFYWAAFTLSGSACIGPGDKEPEALARYVPTSGLLTHRLVLRTFERAGTLGTNTGVIVM